MQVCVLTAVLGFRGSWLSLTLHSTFYRAIQSSWYYIKRMPLNYGQVCPLLLKDPLWVALWILRSTGKTECSNEMGTKTQPLLGEVARPLGKGEDNNVSRLRNDSPANLCFLFLLLLLPLCLCFFLIILQQGSRQRDCQRDTQVSPKTLFFPGSNLPDQTQSPTDRHKKQSTRNW
jgi:hypothetical protein